MGRGIAAGVAVGAAAAACFSTPGRSFKDDAGLDGDGQRPDMSTPGSGTDAAVDAPVGCTPIPFNDAINSCGSWAETRLSLGSAAQSGGQLQLSLTGSGSASAECRTAAPRAFDHAILEVVSVKAGSGFNERTYFAVENTINRWGFNWIYESSRISIGVVCPGEVTTPPRQWLMVAEAVVQMRRAGAMLVFEVGQSTTGPWSEVATCTPGDAALNDAKVVVGASHGSGTPATAAFASLLLCP